MYDTYEFITLDKDVKQIAGDYLFNFGKNFPILEDTIEYVFLILSDIYDKQFFKKNIYPEIIKQIICNNYRDIYGDKFNNFSDKSEKLTVNKLKLMPQVEQRTPEWFKLKEDSIGASEAASIFNKNIFSSYNKLLLKKSGFKEENHSSIACIHGTKYEKIVQNIYEKIFNLKLIDFGSITHPDIKYISASPDGITSEGTMVEIKVPIKRCITGIPPIYYWIQMQQQMQVCRLNQVDFVECKIYEHINFENFDNDLKEYTLDNNENFKSFIIEYHEISENKISWCYPEKILNKEEMFKWKEEQLIKIKNSKNKIFSRIIYYAVEKISITKVWRDDEWWNENLHKYKEFWELVTNYRKIGYDSLIKKKKKKIINCDIMSDTE